MWQWIKNIMGFKGKTTTSGTAASVPTGLAVSVVSSSAITATWNASTGSPTGYEVQISTDAAFVTSTTYALGLVLTKAFTGLTASTTYYVRVRSLKTGSPASAWPTGVGATTSAASPPALTVYDGMNRSAGVRVGVTTPIAGTTLLSFVNESQFYADDLPVGSRQTATPDYTKITAWAVALSTAEKARIQICDLEAMFSPSYYHANQASVRTRCDGIAAAIRSGDSNIVFGFYNGLPERDWVDVQPYQKSHSPAVYAAWQTRNTAMQTLDRGVTMANLYVLYEPSASKSPAQIKAEWACYATENIVEAQRIANGTPVIALLWFQYNAGTYSDVPSDWWRVQLDTLRSLGVNGIAIWGGYNGNIDSTAGWYTQTESFIGTL